MNVILKNVVKQKRCTRAILVGAEKNFNQKKSKLKVWLSSRKNSLNHTSETPKKRFFQLFILRSISTCSLYLLQTLVQFDQISVHSNVHIIN